MRSTVFCCALLLGSLGVGHAQSVPLEEEEEEGAPVELIPAPRLSPQATTPIYPVPLSPRATTRTYPVPSSPPSYYYQYPPPPPPRPFYRYDPSVRQELSCQLCTRRPKRTHGRLLALGVRYSFLGVRQEINGQGVNLRGWGGQLRLRGRGHFGLELSVDFLRGQFPAGAVAQEGPARPAGGAPGQNGGRGFFHIGDVSRESYPVAASALIYILPNKADRIFNLYFLGGVGFISTRINLLNQYGRPVSQRFAEYEGHAGVGAELRFRWFSIEANARALGTVRSDRGNAGAYYRGVRGAPVPQRSFGYQATLAASVWF